VDPLLRELRAAVEASELAQLSLYALIDGHLVVGELCAPRLFTDDSNSLVKTWINEAEAGEGPPNVTGDHLRSLLFEHPDVEPDERYITLRWASIVSLRDEVVELPVLRLDTDAISAWWLREWSLPPQRRSGAD
jgi:hypothetical protein